MRLILAIFFLSLCIGCTSTTKPLVECINVESCSALIQNKISNNLDVDENFKGEVIVINFKINDYGEVRNAKVISNSGKKYIELKGLEALNRASPFNELLNLNSKDFEQFKNIKLNIEI